MEYFDFVFEIDLDMTSDPVEKHLRYVGYFLVWLDASLSDVNKGI